MGLGFLHKLMALMRDRGGNVAMIVAFGMPALIGAAGLSVDISQWYLWKRELQHSVDQAAIGSAWALANSNSKDNYRTRAQQEFDANQAITKGFTTTPTVTLASYAGGTNNSVIVTATASKRLPFSSFLTGAAINIAVRSQASFAQGKKYYACMKATSKTGTGLDIGGNAHVDAKCGLAALSCDSNAVVIDGSAIVETDSIATCGTASVPEANKNVLSEHVAGLEDIYADLPLPDDPTAQSQGKCETSGTGQNKTTFQALSAGTYKGGITVKCATDLGPGIYVIDGGVLDLSANYNVKGTNVMFVLKNSARIKFGGEGNNNTITLSPMLASDFTSGVYSAYSAYADQYAGILVMEDKNNNPSNPGHQLTGNSTSLIEGLIYLPSGEMTVLGTANVASQCLQVTAYKIHIKGNASLETLCPPEATDEAGSSQAIVKLVA